MCECVHEDFVYTYPDYAGNYKNQDGLAYAGFGFLVEDPRDTQQVVGK